MQIMSDIRQQVTPYGGRSGAAVQGTYFEPIRFSLDWYVTATSRATLLTQLDAIMAVMNPANGEKLLTIDAFDGWAWYAVLNGQVMLQPQGNCAVSGQFNFLCADGYRVAASSTSQSVTVDSSPETFNVPAAGVVAGNLATEPVWTIINTDSTTVTSVALVNTTRSETLNWGGNLAQNDRLRIDSERQYVELSTNGGVSWGNAMSGLGASAEFPLLTGGSANACSLTGLVAGSLTIAYRARSL